MKFIKTEKDELLRGVGLIFLWQKDAKGIAIMFYKWILCFGQFEDVND